MAIRRVSRNRNRPTIKQKTNTRTKADYLATQTTGRKMVVDYFNKQVSEDETIIPFDLNSSGSLQNYNRISKLEISVIDEIPINTEQKNIEGIGSIMIDGVLPTIGDVFLTTLSGDITAVMRIKSTSMKSYNNNGVHEVTYGLYKILNSDEEIQAFVDVLQPSLLEDLTYDKGHYVNGTNPLIVSSNLIKLHELNSAYIELSNYLVEVINEDIDALPLHKADGKFLIDQEIMRFTKSVLDISDYTLNKAVNVLALVEDNPISILDSLLYGTNESRVCPYNRFILIEEEPKTDESRLILMETIGSVLLTKDIPYPKDEYCDYVSPNGEIFIHDKLNFNSTVTPLFPKLFDETYIFSPQFYGKSETEECQETTDGATTTSVDTSIDTNGETTVDDSNTGTGNTYQTNLSTLETTVRIQLDGGKLSYEDIFKLIDGCYTTNRTEAIYFIPIVLLLSKLILINRSDAF